MRPARGARFATLLAVLLSAATALTGCATGKDAVATGQGFQFVAPGGKEIIFYDPPASRGKLASFTGPSVLHPPGNVGIESYPNQIVVINIWGAWCGVCRPEMTDLQFIQKQMAGSGVSVLGVDIRDSSPDAARDFAQGAGITYDSIYDPPGRVLLQLQGYPRNVVPSTIVLDRRHRVAAVYLTRIPLAHLG
jgi:thiol-disulfide isomerase/thioredoxin